MRWALSGDPFSDVLRLTEARAVASRSMVAGGDWAIRVAPLSKLRLCVVVEGTLSLRIQGHDEIVHLVRGDALLDTGRREAVFGSNLGMPPLDIQSLLGSHNDGVIRIGDSAEWVVLFAAVLLHPSSAALLTDALPPLIHVRATSPEAVPLQWMFERLEHERASTQPGSAVASAQLTQLIFIQILRAHMTGTGASPPGWLRALCDDRIGRALRSMHEAPERNWSLPELAKVAGMSRSTFAARFKSLAGAAPLTYLAQWRMQIAQKLLREEESSVFEIAESLGYASESAFSNAFKRMTGTAPRDYRNAMKRLPPILDEASDLAPAPVLLSARRDDHATLPDSDAFRVALG